MKTFQQRIFASLFPVGFFACINGCDTNDIDPPLRKKEYLLQKVNGTGVNGKVVVTENRDKSFNLEVKLDSSVKDTVHLVHIHNGSITLPASIALLLEDMPGTGAAVSKTTPNISTRLATDGSRRPLNYDSVLAMDGYIDLHYSNYKIDSLISQGNIGKN